MDREMALEMKRVYENDKLTIEEIGLEFNYSLSTVKRALKSVDTKMRTASDARKGKKYNVPTTSGGVEKASSPIAGGVWPYRYSGQRSKF